VTLTVQPSFGPLDGVRVLDLTVALAGGSATMLLADLGAEVIRVESLQHYPTSTKGPRNPPRQYDPKSPVTLRDYPNGDPGNDPWNRLSWYNSHARNKRSVTMDLTRDAGRDLFLRLVERSDGLVENNGIGLLEKLELGPDVLLERNPLFVVVRMPPLGLSGPDAHATGFGWHFEDLGGVLRVQGYPDGPEVGSIFMDGASGPAGASAFVMGLLQVQGIGHGTVAEVAQLENMICHFGDLTMESAMTGHAPPRWGNRSPVFVPQGCYRSAGDDRWVVLSVRDDTEWGRLVELLGDESLRSAALNIALGRRSAHDTIDKAITAWTTERTAEEAAVALQAIGIPAGPVMTEEDAYADPQLHVRGFFELREHPSCGLHLEPGVNFRMSLTPPVIWRAAPRLGEDNDYIYREILHISEDEYDCLVRDRHIGTAYL
jgi:crotonobetainyl-CoA:carnitine CoA-transferase CaiB-like acyl-CoA transferase